MCRRYLALLLFVLGSMLMSVPVATSAAEPSGKLLRHIVLYKFKPELTSAQVREVVDTFAALPAKIDVIVSLEKGTNVSEEGKSEGFTHSFVVTFRSEQDRDAYLVHPAHQAYVNVVRDRREKVIVFDYWTE